MSKIITQTTQNVDKISSSVSSVENFYSRFKISQIAKELNMNKSKGIPFRTLFCFLISAIFSNKSAYRDYLMNEDRLEFSDKSFRNLLNDGRINWNKFMCLLCAKIWAFITPLTSEERKNALVWDDTMYLRKNAKKVELAAIHHDHAENGKSKYKKGFKQIMLGITDGNTFLPVNFSLQSAKKKIAEAKKFDKRSNAYKKRERAEQKTPDVAIELLKEALKYGVRAPYILFDSWFSSPAMFHKIKELGIDAVCMLKKTPTHLYEFNGEKQNVKSIFNKCKKRRGRSRYLLSVLVNSVVDGKHQGVNLKVSPKGYNPSLQTIKD